MEIIVTYNHIDMRSEAEKDFNSLKEAIHFADSTIEDGGTASITIYLGSNDTEPVIPPYTLCDIHIEWNS